jgi:hypothetical protein
MRKFAATAIKYILLFMLSIPASTCADKLKKGMDFFVARKLLIREGWNPISMHEKDDYPYSGVEKELIALNIKEIESCAMDRAMCLFNYKKNNQCLQLETQGEDINTLRVFYWTNECPNGY